MINKILSCIKDLSIKKGFKFRDKTWKYDTIYFSVKLFAQYINNKKNDVINIDKNVKSEIIAGFKNFLQLKNTSKAAKANNNYYDESLNFLISTNILEKKDEETSLIKNKEIFEYIGYSMETAYIFQYLCAYTAFNNDSLWNEYIRYYLASNFEEKTKILEKIIENIKSFLQNNKSKGKWVKFVTKFFMMILGLPNGECSLSRDCKINGNKKISPIDLANRAGTKTETTKFNDYSDPFNLEQVCFLLKDYLLIKYCDAKNVKPLEHYTIENLSPKILEIWNDVQKATEMNGDLVTKIDIFKKPFKKWQNLSYNEKAEAIENINFLNLKSQHNNSTNQRKRDQFIAWIAKIKSNYLDELTSLPSFEDKNGNNYVEAHHILEFGKEKGPDILLNLICLGPEHHAMIHHGSQKIISCFFQECRKKGIITMERFKKMCIEYQCLTQDHVQFLLNKSIITHDESKYLLNLIKIFGCKNAPTT